MQTSPISFIARGKGPFSACNKGNRRRLHAGNSFVSSHLKLFKDILLLKIRFNALTSKLLYSCCALCFSVQGGRILARTASADSPSRLNRSLEQVHNVPEGDAYGDELKRKGTGEEKENR